MTFKEKLKKAKETKVDKVHWKVQTSGENYAQCVPFINAIQTIHILNDIFVNWNDDYKIIQETHDIRKDKKGNEYYIDTITVECTITVIDENGNSIIRKGIGEDTNYKAAESDSLKRAAKKFNIGSFLFELDKVWFYSRQVQKNKKEKWTPTDEKGNLLEFDRLTDYINSRKNLHDKVERQIEHVEEKNNKFNEQKAKLQKSKLEKDEPDWLTIHLKAFFKHVKRNKQLNTKRLEDEKFRINLIKKLGGVDNWRKLESFHVKTWVEKISTIEHKDYTVMVDRILKAIEELIIEEVNNNTEKQSKKLEESNYDNS